MKLLTCYLIYHNKRPTIKIDFIVKYSVMWSHRLHWISIRVSSLVTLTRSSAAIKLEASSQTMRPTGPCHPTTKRFLAIFDHRIKDKSCLARFISDCPHLTRTLRRVPLERKLKTIAFPTILSIVLH